MTDPKVDRDKKLIRNRAQCSNCGDVIESKHRHDFVWCKCKAIYIDGGLAYSKYGYTNPLDFIDLCEFEP